MGDAFVGNRFNYKAIAAGQTTAPICGEGGYIARIQVANATSAAGAWSLLDGTTVIYAGPTPVGSAAPQLTYNVDLGIFADTTKGFNITTGASVSVLVSGNFTPIVE